MKNISAKSSFYSNVLVTGSVAFDEIMDFPGKFIDYFQADKLHQINISFVVNRLEKQIGGIATNITYNLHLMLNDKDKVTLLGAVGKDGEIFIKWLKENNMSAKGVIVDDTLYTSSGKVITDKKDNQIWGYYYGALERGRDIDLKKYKGKKSILILSSTHHDAFMNFQEQAIKLGMDYLYDPGMALSILSRKELEEGVNNCKWLIGNDYELSQVFKILQTDIIKLTNKGIAVITTLGDQGVNYLDKKNNFNVKAYKVKKMIDPTGAGDAWRGGFIGSLIEGKSIEESLKIGNALASFAVEKYGTINHKPTKKEILERVKLL